MAKRICEECGKPLPKDAGYRTKLHKACSDQRRRDRQRSTPPESECEVCEATFQPYRTGQTVCQAPECRARKKREVNRRATGYGTRLEDEKPREDPQMERLVANYQAKDSIEITERDEGSRLVVISDAQLPFIDEALWQATLKFIEDFKPHDVIINGDWLDCYEISDFDKNPNRLFGLQTELEMASDNLDDLRKRVAVGGKVWWIDGNHEERMNRVIWKRAQGFAFLVADIEQALRLDQRCAGYVPYGKHIDYLGFTVTHGNFVSQHSAYTAKKHAERYHSSGCNGHTHRLGSFSYTDGKRRSHTWHEIGCLCRTDLEYTRGIANWQQGFLAGTVHYNALHPGLVRVVETDTGRGFDFAGKYYRINDEVWNERAA